MKTAIITGCTKGIGAAVTKKFLNSGCKVYGCFAGDEENAKVFCENLGDLKERCMVFKSDLSTINGINKFINRIKESVSSIDYIVFNAGMTDRTLYREINYDMWNKVMHVNLYAPLFIVQGLDCLLNEFGRIVFIGSILGDAPHAMSLSYAVSKSGLHQMAKNLVKEYADRKITVNVVAPGFVDTPWQKNKAVDHRKRIEDKIALKRFAEPDEIAQLCWSIVENDYINGSIFRIDGGYDYR